MPDLENSGLDDRIRELVARAVADAPAAPTIDDRTLQDRGVLQRNHHLPPDRNRRIAGGIAGLSVAAAVIALFFVTRPDDRAEPGPATRPATTIAAIPPATSFPTASTPSTEVIDPSTVAPTVAPVVDTTPMTSAPPTSSDPPPPDGVGQASTVMAGPTGVSVLLEVGEPTIVTASPTLIAVRTADGSIWVQQSDPYADGASASLGVIDDGSGQIRPVALPAEISGGVRLHDAAVIDGEAVVLLEERPDVCRSGNDCEGTLWLFRPQSATAELLTTMNVWEAGWSQLSLATNGVIVGDVSESVSVSPFSMLIAGTTATTIDFSALGLDDSYADCSTCPSSFRIDSTGRYVAWMERSATGGATISVATVDGSTIVRVPLVLPGGVACCESPEGDVLPLFGSIDLADVAIDPAIGTVTAGRAVINRVDTTSDIAGLWVDLATGEATSAPADTWVAFGG